MHKELAQKLSLVDNIDGETDDLRKTVATLETELGKQADLIGKGRREAVPRLREEIFGLLQSLGIKDSQFDVEFVETKDFKPNGKDSVKFMFSEVYVQCQQERPDGRTLEDGFWRRTFTPDALAQIHPLAHVQIADDYL